MIFSQTLKSQSTQSSTLLNQNNLRDFIYGAIDGTVTTLAIVAGVQGAGLSSQVVIILGVANVLADGFSMAASNFSGTKAEMDNQKRIRLFVAETLDKDPEEKQRILLEILHKKGLTPADSSTLMTTLSNYKPFWVDMIMADHFNVSSVNHRPFYGAITTFSAFLLCGMVPLLPFILDMPEPFSFSILATAITFFAIGATKSIWSMTPWWHSALETLFIGGTAATIAYLVGRMFH